MALGEGVGRWAVEAGLPHVPVRGAVAFPLKRSRIALEEPEDEIVTTDNGPWWGNAIGRARRLDQAPAPASWLPCSMRPSTRREARSTVPARG